MTITSDLEKCGQLTVLCANCDFDFSDDAARNGYVFCPRCGDRNRRTEFRVDIDAIKTMIAAAPSPPDEGREIVRALADAKMLIGLICLGDAKAAEDLLSRVRRAAAYIESTLPKDENRNG